MEDFTLDPGLAFPPPSLVHQTKKVIILRPTRSRYSLSLPSLSFFSFRFHYMDFPDCLLLLLSISVFLLFSFFCFYTFLVVGSVR